MNSNNNARFIKESSLHVSNINKALKNVKSEVLVNFIWSEQLGITVVICKVVSSSDLLIIENYIKNVKCINVIGVNVLCLPQSKSYLKIIDISYYSHNNSQEHLLLGDVKKIIKQNQIFDNIILTSKPWVIRVSPKLDMPIIWVDIWNIQSRSKAKSLIN